MTDPHEHIDAYLLGKLSGSERAAFETLLRNDPDLRKELEFRKHVVEGLKQADAEDVRSRIAALARQGSKPPFPWIWLAVASFALFLTVGGWILFSPGKPDGKALFTAYYHPQIQLDLARDSGATATLADTLQERYLAADYASLEARLSSLADSAKTRNLQVLEAVSLIELGRDGEAETLLTALMDASPSEYTEQATWLKALLHLRNARYEQAKVLLKPIAATPGQLHQAEAQEILQQIEDN